MPDNTRISDVVIHSIERKTNSTNGNPRYELHTNQGSFTTAPDSSLGYGIENYTNSRHQETFVIGNPANPTVTLLATKAKKVWGIEYRGQALT